MMLDFIFNVFPHQGKCKSVVVICSSIHMHSKIAAHYTNHQEGRDSYIAQADPARLFMFSHCKPLARAKARTAEFACLQRKAAGQQGEIPSRIDISNTNFLLLLEDQHLQ